MSDAKELRARAARLLTLAINARELGIEAYGMALVKLARYVLAQAEALERRGETRRSGYHATAVMQE
jgi:hypothetical protein